MKYFLSLLILLTSITYAECDLSFKSLDKKMGTLDKEECSNFDLYGNSIFARMPFITEKIDIHKLMGHTLSRNDYNNNNKVLTSYFWDKNNVYNLNYLYVATDVQDEKSMVIITDNDGYIRIIGEKNKKLFESILKSENFPLDLLYNPKIKSTFDFFYD